MSISLPLTLLIIAVVIMSFSVFGHASYHERLWRMKHDASANDNEQQETEE